MTHSHGVRLGALAAVVPLFLVLAACGDDEEAKNKAAANAACPANINTATSTQLPSDLPSPGGTAYDHSSQGKTQVWFFAIDGSADQLPELRDTYNNTLKGKGYTLGDTDQEEGAEAEGEFSGPHDGTTNFRPLCTGKVVLRLKITS